MDSSSNSETLVERRLRNIVCRHDPLRRKDTALDDAAIDAGREALALLRESIPRYTQNGCSNCGGVPHSSTCMIGRADALIARCQDGA